MSSTDWLFGHVGLFVTVGCALLAAAQSVQVAMGIWSVHWPVVPGTIHGLEYRESEDTGDMIPQVSYGYEFAGRTFAGRRIWFEQRHFTSYSKMVDCLGPILPGSPHPVRVCAMVPRLAVLLPGTSMLGVASLVFIVGATIASARWLA